MIIELLCLQNVIPFGYAFAPPSISLLQGWALWARYAHEIT